MDKKNSVIKKDIIINDMKIKVVKKNTSTVKMLSSDYKMNLLRKAKEEG